MDHDIVGEKEWSGKAGWADQLLRHPYGVLLFLYALSVIVRIPMVFAAGDLPFIFNDEMRYMHIAKSILSGEVLIRNQPVVYKYILYPLILSPAYLLPESFNVFRVMQVINALLMHSMIFPLYALAQKITKDRSKAILIAALSLLLPDTALIKNIMTESLAYPLFFLTLLFIYQMFTEKNRTRHYVRTGVYCFLLYTIKPSYACVGAACFIAATIHGVKLRDKARILRLAAFAGTIVLAFIAYMGLLKGVFSMDPFGKTHYDVQNNPFSLDHVLITIKGMLTYAHYHLIAFYVIPPIALLCGWKKYEPSRKLLGATVLLTILLTWLLTVYVIYVDEYYMGGEPLRVHVRYAAMLFPVLLAYLLTEEMKGFSLKGGVACLAFLGVGLAFYDVNLFIGTRDFPVDSMMMAMLFLKEGAWDGVSMYFPLLLSILIPISCFAIRDGLQRRVLNGLVAVIIVGLCANQFASYTRNQNPHYGNYLDDAGELMAVTGGNAWMVCGDGQEEWAPAVAFDVKSRCEMPVVTLGALLRATHQDGTVDAVLRDSMGKYVNDVPTYPYSRSDFLIFDVALFDRIAFPNRDQVFYSSDNLYGYMPVAEGEPWINSVLYGLSEGQVVEGSYFAVYDAHALSKDRITLRFSVLSSSGNGSLTIYTDDGQDMTFSGLTNDVQWVEAVFETRDAKPFKVWFEAAAGPVSIETYLIVGDEQ